MEKEYVCILSSEDHCGDQMENRVCKLNNHATCIFMVETKKEEKE